MIDGFPGIMDVSKNGNIVYITIKWLHGALVVDLDKRKGTNLINLIDPDTFPVNGIPAYGLALTPDEKNLYIASQILNTVFVANTATLEIEKQIPVRSKPSWIGFTPNGKFAYISNKGSDDVSVINVRQGKVSKNIVVGPKPNALALGERIITKKATAK